MPNPLARAGAVLTIDLEAICANWRLLQERRSQPGNTAAVVKADAYGLGAARVAPALQAAGCRRFVVATLDEGIALRPLLPGAEIMVLSGPFPGGEAEFHAYGLLPVLNSPAQVGGWAAFARQRGERLPCVLHVDTGMSRLGLRHDEAVRLSEDCGTLSALDMRLIMSHLACADEPDHDLNRLQRDRFNAARALFPSIEGSLAASSGIFLGEGWQADWTRPGYALYGGNPIPGQPNPMRQVVRLQGRIIQVRDVDGGDTVGYGATHRCAAPTRLAVVAAGYADGLFRSLGNRGCGHLGDCRVPLVGRVSMDLTIFDIGAAPQAAARPGAMLDLIGPHNDIDQIADAAGTIGYEVLTALSSRYHRDYLEGTPPRSAS